MPWTATREFAHPLLTIISSGSNLAVTNYLSYILVDGIIWQGLGSVINRFRYKVLGLQPIDPTLAPGILQRMHIPFSYCWSSTLIPKPQDWASNVDVHGYCTLSDNEPYSPSKSLLEFLRRGPPPVYIGFGSIVVRDPDSLVELILQAVETAGVRAIIYSGWASLKFEDVGSDRIFLLPQDCPHDYLFAEVSMAIHHGGAGTIAAGLTAGRPTVVIPFFGDQFFWGDMIYRAQLGPAPIPYTTLTAPKLTAAILMAHDQDMKMRVETIAKLIKNENGAQAVVASFHQHFPQVKRCCLFPQKLASWRYDKKSHPVQHLSHLGVTVLRKKGLISLDKLNPIGSAEYAVASGPYEPISGATWAIVDLLYDSLKGMGEILTEVGHVPYLGVKAFNKGKTAVREGANGQLPPSGGSSKHSLPGSFFVRGTLRLSKAAIRAPGEFTSAMASGSHNLPLLYNDPTVRPTPQVTGIASGLKAGVTELGLGVYDGITGLFMQPIMGAIRPHGAQNRSSAFANGPEKAVNGNEKAVNGNEKAVNGNEKAVNGDDKGQIKEPSWTASAAAVGFAKGLGRGAVGLPIKFFAAVNGIVGYPLKGMDREVIKAWQGDLTKELRNQKLLQGEKEYYSEGFTFQQVDELAAMWHQLQTPSQPGA